VLRRCEAEERIPFYIKIMLRVRQRKNCLLEIMLQVRNRKDLLMEIMLQVRLRRELAHGGQVPD
jgi:hypothetical protein